MPNRANPANREHFHRGHARELRNNATEAERWLWLGLRDRRLDGVRFRRQLPLGNYVVDFCTLSEKLIVELDGSQHYLPDAVSYDAARTRWLEGQGFVILRFRNEEVLKERPRVLDVIWNTILERRGSR